MHGVGICTSDVCRNRDLRHVGTLIIPPVICMRVLLEHLSKAFDAVAALQHVLGDEMVKEVSAVDASASKLFTVKITASFPGRNRFERWRLQSSNKPLYNCKVRVPCHSHIAITPRLLRRPLNDVVSILRLLSTHNSHTTLGVERAARINVQNRVSPVHELGWVRCLEFLKSTECSIWDTQIPWCHQLERLDAVELFAEWTPAQDCRGRSFGCVVWSVDVCVQSAAIPDLDGNIMFDKDVTRKNSSSGSCCATFAQHLGAWLEAFVAFAWLRGRKLLPRHIDVEFDRH